MSLNPKFCFIGLFTAGIFLATGTAMADFSVPRTDDSDLSGPASILALPSVPLVLPIDQVETVRAESGARVQVLRDIKGSWTPIVGLRFSVTQAGAAPRFVTLDETGAALLEGCNGNAGTELLWEARLENEKIQVSNGRESYRISFSAPCGTQSRLLFHQDSNGGQALGIWQVVSLAQRKLESSIGLQFWRSQLRFVWPSSGDFYSWGEVNITRGDYWDVVGHEMGHAIYDMGAIGAFGGGQHRIDECYTETLALSEGWASYFSAWVSLALDDADAKFEYMVPRRAPIQLENVPADVCNGQKNEWRVASFLWDLIDLNNDGEPAQNAFSQLWNALQGSKVRTASEAASRLERAGVPRDWIRLVWELNFRTPR